MKSAPEGRRRAQGRLAPGVIGLALLLPLAAAYRAAAVGPSQDATPRQRAAAGSLSLEFAGHVRFPPAMVLERLGGVVFGGLSGLAADGTRLLAVSDDPRAPRVFALSLSLAPASFAVSPESVIHLRAAPNGPRRLDLEAIAIAPDGNMWLAAEASTAGRSHVPPSVLEYSRSGGFMRRLEVPAKFVADPRGKPARGVRNNEGFESLTLAPDGGVLFAGRETPLVQDGPPADIGCGGRARILTFALHEGGRAAAEYVYPLDPLPRVDFLPGLRINGLVDLVALDRTHLLALERGFVQERIGPLGRAFVRVYHVSLDEADDVSSLFALGERRDVRPAAKRLLFDLGNLASRVPGLERLDNFEGMALLPPDASGRRYLVLVSDDNFNPVQRTWFLLFRVVAGKA